MVLSESERERFLGLFDALMMFVDGKRQLETGFFNPKTEMVEPRLQMVVADELWRNLTLIDEFVAENPSHMPEYELSIIQSWKHAVSGKFLVLAEPDVPARFIADDHVFEVWGITDEISAMMERMPAYANAVLLPFEGKIVIDTFLSELPLETAYEDMAKTLTHAILHGINVHTADELIACAPTMLEKRLQRETDEMMEDLEFEMGTDKLAHGQRRGALAGLDEDARAAAIKAHLKAMDNPADMRVWELLSSVCEYGFPCYTMPELLELDVKETLQSYAKNLRLRRYSQLTKPKLIEMIVEAFTESPVHIEHFLETCNLDSVRAYRRLADNGGVLKIDSDDIPSLKELPQPHQFICYLFHSSGGFEFVMPKEVVELCRSLPWDEYEALAGCVQRAAKLAESIVALRGIVSMHEVVDECERTIPELKEQGLNTVAEIAATVSMGNLTCDILLSDQGAYLLHNTLAEDAMRIDNGTYDGSPIHRGPLGAYLEELLAVQRNFPPRVLPQDLAEASSYFEWAMKQQSCLALRDYLDAHVPEDSDEYFFADDVMAELIDMSHGGYKPEDYVNYLTEVGAIGDASGQKRHVVNLVRNMVGMLPSWPCGGWSPNEAFNDGLGPRMFFNEDGSPMRVGSNDPCPCGSGKKYKDCCGHPNHTYRSE